MAIAEPALHLYGQRFKTNVRLEEVVSSEQQLVQVLVSGPISYKTMTSLSHGPRWNNQKLEGNQV